MVLMKVTGTVGKNGSGKDEVLKYLRDAYGIPFYSTGDMVREIAKSENLEPTRENLCTISQRYFDKMGDGCFVRLLADKIRENPLPAVGIGGIRSLADVIVLKTAFGDGCVIVNVDVADPCRRFLRMKARGEERDPKTYEKFEEHDQREEALFHIEKAQDTADFTIHNDGSLSDLHAAIERLVREKNLLGFIP